MGILSGMDTICNRICEKGLIRICNYQFEKLNAVYLENAWCVFYSIFQLYKTRNQRTGQKSHLIYHHKPLVLVLCTCKISSLVNHHIASYIQILGTYLQSCACLLVYVGMPPFKAIYVHKKENFTN